MGDYAKYCITAQSDSVLAELYQVEIKVLNQAVKRNLARFPDDFMFQLTAAEAESLRSQFVTLETGRGKYTKYLPHAFTEQGVAMLSSVLRSQRAILVNRDYARLRSYAAVDELQPGLGQKTGCT